MAMNKRTMQSGTVLKSMLTVVTDVSISSAVPPPVPPSPFLPKPNGNTGESEYSNEELAQTPLRKASDSNFLSTQRLSVDSAWTSTVSRYSTYFLLQFAHLNCRDSIIYWEKVGPTLLWLRADHCLTLIGVGATHFLIGRVLK